jgi:endonuclease YncB( thermonuclease family)
MIIVNKMSLFRVLLGRLVVGLSIVVVLTTMVYLLSTTATASPDAGAQVCPEPSRPALVLRAVDGDTLDLNIDIGFDLTFHTHARILGINCPEVRGVTKPAGDKATAFTRAYLTGCNSKVTVRDRGPDKYGRRLLLVDCAGKDLATELLKSGNAVVYNP